VPLPPLPTCRPSQLGLGLAQEPAVGASLVVSVRIVNNGTPCRLRGNLSIHVLDAVGPDAVQVFADLDRELTAMAFAWENWCGAPGKFTLRLTLGALSTSSSVDAPACADPRSGTGLRSTQSAFLLAPLRAGVDFDRLRGDAHRAAEVALALAPGRGFTAVIVSVSEESYRDLMCGRQSFAVEDRPVWAVALLIVSRRVSSPPPGVTPEDPATLPTTMLFIIDAATFDSLQTFSPWPLARAPGSNCP